MRSRPHSIDDRQIDPKRASKCQVEQLHWIDEFLCS